MGRNEIEGSFWSLNGFIYRRRNVLAQHFKVKGHYGNVSLSLMHSSDVTAGTVESQVRKAENMNARVMGPMQSKEHGDVASRSQGMSKEMFSTLEAVQISREWPEDRELPLCCVHQALDVATRWGRMIMTHRESIETKKSPKLEGAKENLDHMDSVWYVNAKQQ